MPIFVFCAGFAWSFSFASHQPLPNGCTSRIQSTGPLGKNFGHNMLCLDMGYAKFQALSSFFLVEMTLFHGPSVVYFLLVLNVGAWGCWDDHSYGSFPDCLRLAPRFRQILSMSPLSHPQSWALKATCCFFPEATALAKGRPRDWGKYH